MMAWRSLNEKAVAVAVIAAFELQDQVAPGESPRHTNRRHRRFGTAVHEADHLDRRDAADDLLGELDFLGSRRPVVRALADGTLRGLGDFGVRVTQNQRAPREHVVYVLGAVYIAQP
jgi:hypothetical protein